MYILVERRIMMKLKQKLLVGDEITCRGIHAVIGKILSQDFYKGDVDIEFYDSMGKYRHYKSNLDGGRVIYYNNSKELIAYLNALDSTISILSTLTDIEYLEISSASNGDTRFKLSNKGSISTILLNSNYKIKEWKGSLFLWSVQDVFLEDLPRLVKLNPNIKILRLEFSPGQKYFTRVVVDRIDGKEDLVLIK